MEISGWRQRHKVTRQLHLAIWFDVERRRPIGVSIRWKDERDREWLAALVCDQWAGDPLIVHGDQYQLADSPTLIAGERDGVAVFTYGDRGYPPELLLLHALRQGAGIGSALIATVVAELRARDKHCLMLTTTNDNVAALRFYQRRGFRLHGLRIGAVDAARLRKPTIPVVGFDEIELHDEIDLVLDF